MWPSHDSHDDDINLNFEESSKSILDNIIEKSRDGLFGVLFTMGKQTNHSPLLTLTRYIIDFLQVLAFTFSQEATFQWNEKATKFLNITRYVRIDAMNLFDNPETNDIVWLVLATVVVILTLSDAVYVGISFSRNQIRHVWPLRLLREFAGLIVSIGYIPLVSIFLKVLRCEDGKSRSLGLECMGGWHIFLSSITISLSVLLFLFASLVTACFYNANPTRTDVLARPHARAELIYLVVRTILTLSFAIIDPRDSSNHVTLAVLLIACSSISAISLIFFMPLYNLKFVLWRVSLFCIWTWTNLVLLSVVLADRGENEYGIEFLCFVAIPFVVFLAFAAVEMRRSNINNTSMEHLRSAYEAELKIRWYLEKHHVLFDEDLASHHSSSDVARQTKHFGVVKNMYDCALRSFRSSSTLRLFAAHFYSHYLKNQQLWTSALATVENCNPGLDERFNVYRQRKFVSENLSNKSSDVLSYLEFEHTLQQAQNEIETSLSVQKSFWGELLEHVPDFSKLQRIGSKINRHVTEADGKCRHLLKLNRSSPVVLRVYAGFLLNVVNDQKQGLRMLKRADRLEVQNNEMANNVEEIIKSNIGPTSESALLTVDCNNIIIKANLVATKVSGYSMSELVGMHVNDLLPAIIRDSHSRLMAKFTSGSFSSVDGNERKFFFQNKAGNLLALAVSLRTVSQMNGEVTNVLSIRPDPDSQVKGKHYALVETPSGRVHCYTRDFDKLLNVPTSDLYNFLLIEYIPNLLETLEESISKPITCSVGKENHKVSIELSTRKLMTESLVLVSMVELTKASPEVAPTRKQFEQEQHRQGGDKNTASSQSPALVSSLKPTPQATTYPSLISNSVNQDAHIDENEQEADKEADSKDSEDAMLAHRMRMKILQDDKKIEKGVIVLAIALIASTILIMYLTVDNLLHTNSSNKEFAFDLENMQLMTRQKQEIIGISLRFRLLDHANWTGEDNLFNSTTTAQIPSVQDAISLVEKNHELLYLRETDLNSSMAHAFQHLYIDISELLPESQVSTTRRLSYADSVYYLLLCATEILHKNNKSSEVFAEDYYVVTENAPRSMERVLSELTDTYNYASLAVLSDLKSFKWWFFGESMILMVCLTCCVFLPTIFQVERNKDEVLGYFLHLPYGVLQQMHRNCVHALKSLDEDNLDDSNETRDYRFASAQFTEKKEVPRPGDSGITSTTTNPSKGTTSLMSAMKSKLKTKMSMSIDSEQTRPYHKSRKQLLKFISQIVLLLFIFIVYVVFSHVQDLNEIRWNRLVSSEVYVSASVHYHARSLLSSSVESALATNASEREFWAMKANNSLAFLEIAQHALLYGGILNITQVEYWNDYVRPVQSIPGSVKRYPRRDAFLFEDACTELHGTEKEICTSWFPAISQSSENPKPSTFKHGFQTAYTEMLAFAHSIVHLLDENPAEPTAALTKLMTDKATIMYTNMLAFPMRVALDQSSQFYMSEYIDKGSDFSVLRYWSFWLFLVSVTLVICINYIPLMVRIDHEMKRTRSMLLLLPSSVLQEIPTIQKMMKNFNND